MFCRDRHPELPATARRIEKDQGALVPVIIQRAAASGALNGPSEEPACVAIAVGRRHAAWAAIATFRA